MSVLPYGIRPSNAYVNAPNNGELVAATPLGRDADGKNLVAYIVRTEDEAPTYKPPGNLANSNAPRRTAADVTPPQTYAPPKIAPKPQTAAKFIKPDELLNRQEQAQLEQLRERSNDVQSDVTQLDDGQGNELLTSFVYSTGPDGRRYAVGVSAPLLTQKNKREAPDTGDSSPTARAALAYRQSSYNNHADDRAGLLDRAL